MLVLRMNDLKSAREPALRLVCAVDPVVVDWDD